MLLVALAAGVVDTRAAGFGDFKPREDGKWLLCQKDALFPKDGSTVTNATQGFAWTCKHPDYSGSFAIGIWKRKGYAPDFEKADPRAIVTNSSAGLDLSQLEAGSEYAWCVCDEENRWAEAYFVYEPVAQSESIQEEAASASQNGGIKKQQPLQREVKVTLLDSEFDQKARKLTLRWLPAGKDARSIAYYDIVVQDSGGKTLKWNDKHGNPTTLRQKPTGHGTQSYSIPMGQRSGTHHFTVQAYDSASRKLGDPDRQTVEVAALPQKAADGAPNLIRKARGMAKTAGIIIGVVAVIAIIVLVWRKLMHFTDDRDRGYERDRGYATQSRNDYVDTASFNEWARHVKGIDQKIGAVEQRLSSLSSSVQQVSTQISSAKQEATLAKQSAVHEVQKVRTALGDYVTGSQLRSHVDQWGQQQTSAMEDLSQRVAQDIQSMQSQVAALQNDIQAMRNERLAEKNAAVVEASRRVDSLLEQVGKGLPPEAASLINGLAAACYADALPQLMKVGQRLLNEVCSSEGGQSLKAYVEAVNKVHEIRDELNKLLSQPTADAEQRATKLAQEADQVVRTCVEAQSAASVDNALIDQAKRTLMKEAAMPYVSIVMGRYQGDGEGAYKQIKDVLQNLGLDLIDIAVGQTRPDSRLHDVQSSMSSDKYPSGTIANVVRMGYTNRSTGEVTKAQVIVAQ